ncbi:MAG: beta-glucuronidase [Alistipes sp.]|nr:beta-glucuronidase [Alistipes sp.]
MMDKTIFAVLVLLAAFRISAQDRTMDLSGSWRFEIDREDKGVSEQWYSRRLEDVIVLPGSMAENRKGDDVTIDTRWMLSVTDSTFYFDRRLAKFREPDNLKVPFCLTPVKYYAGAAWYQRDIEVPDSWEDGRVLLFFERPHWETTLWVNDREAGMQNSLSVPHIFDVTDYLRPGHNTLTVRVDNRIKEIDVGLNSHSISDHTQGNWNGIAGRMELQTTPVTYIGDLQVYPDIRGRKAVVEVTVEGNSAGTVRLAARSYNGEETVRTVTAAETFRPSDGAARVMLELEMGDDMVLWDEFNPNLYSLTATVETPDGVDTKTTRFGMREFTIEGTYFYVNGRKTALRGTVDCAAFPLTGYPPTDLDSWLRIFTICKQYGLNHMRFHSYNPPDAAMEAADLTGFYLQPEGPSWPNHSTTLGDGLPVDDYLWEEAHRIVARYGNYPSFCMFAIGNEPRGRYWVDWVSRFVDYWKEKDPRRVYTGASVGGSWAWQPRNQFHVKAGVRGVDWDDTRPETRSDFRHQLDTVRQPYVAHEIGQYCVYPDFTEIKKYTGVMRARNFERFREDLADRGMGDQATDFLMTSGKLQALCYKHDIERNLRTPGYAGFQLLGINDFPGQGTALVGVLNAFYEEKAYITAREFRKFCAPTVLLSRMDKFVYTADETLTADIEVAHFGQGPVEGAVVEWRLRDAYGAAVRSGTLPGNSFGVGNCQYLGSVELPLDFVRRAGKFTLEVALRGTDITNDWDLWVYPAVSPRVDTGGIYITTAVDEKARETLAGGGKVLLLLDGKVKQGADVVQYMRTSFWNTSWFRMRPPHTQGSLVNNYHPALREFPTDDWTGLQWWEILNRAQVMELTDFPEGFRPIIQPVDTWFMNRRLGTLFEARSGGGKLMVCSADLRSDLSERPAARQLLYSILRYMDSHLFLPGDEVDLRVIENLCRVAGEEIDMMSNEVPDDWI